MTIHVNIREAKTRRSGLVSAARRGEDVVLAKPGEPQVRLIAIGSATAVDIERRAAKRRSAIGMWASVANDRDIDIKALQPTEEDLEERYQRKFGDPA